MTEMKLLHHIVVFGVDVEKRITQTIVPKGRMNTSCDMISTSVFRRDIIEWLEQQSIDFKGFTTLFIKVEACDAVSLQPVFDASLFVSVVVEEKLVFSWAGDRNEREWKDLENGVQSGNYNYQHWIAVVTGTDCRIEVIPSMAVLDCVKNGVFSIPRIQGPEVKRTVKFIPFS